MSSPASIADSSLFRGLQTKHLELVGAIGQSSIAAEGEKIFRTGDRARALFVLIQGIIELTLPLSVLDADQEIVTQELSAGDTFGWSALVEPHRLTMSARAKNRAELVAFEGRKLKDFFRANPEIGYLVMTNLAVIIGKRLSVANALWARELQHSIDQKYGRANGGRQERS